MDIFPKNRKSEKNIHNSAAFVLECVEDSFKRGLITFYLDLFCQPIILGTLEWFNLFENHTYFLDL